MGRKPNKPVYAPLPRPNDPQLRKGGRGTSGVQRRSSVNAGRSDYGRAIRGAAPSVQPHRGKFGGCGFFIVVIALLMIIAIVGFLVAGFTDRPSAPEPTRVEVPDHVPPKAAKPAPDIDIHHPGRTSEQLLPWAKSLSEKTGIPEQSLIAYGNAEVIARQSRPSCNLAWNTLAGLGFVETRHGTYDGKRFGAAEIDAKGNTTPPIFECTAQWQGVCHCAGYGQGEDGRRQEIRSRYGALQFIPESWERYGVDADGNDNADPQNIDDAAASAVRLLCDFERDLATPEGWTKAVRSYNMSNEYVRNVRDAAANYAVGQRPLG